MSYLDTGLSAIRAQQRALETIGNNIANANTPGYHRQRVDLATALPSITNGFSIGQGVSVAGISQIRSELLEASILRETSSAADAGSRLSVLQQVESLLTPSDGSIHSSLSSFFNDLTAISAQPTEHTVRNEVLASAQSLLNELRRIDNGLVELRKQIGAEIDTVLREINSLTTELAELNNEIQKAEGIGAVPNDLIDRRDSLLGQLSELTDVRSADGTGSYSTLLVAEGTIVIGRTPQDLGVETTTDGRLALTYGGAAVPPSNPSGRLGALLEAYNSTIPATRQQLQEWSTAFVGGIDRIHATGVGLSGSFNVLESARPVDAVNTPLAGVGLAFPVEAGNLYVTVTDTATGEKTTHAIAIDPQTDSLSAIAARLTSTVDHLQASTDPVSGKLSVWTEVGYEFDFTGAPTTSPDLAAWSGAASPQIGGLPTGVANGDWTYTVRGTGEVGVASALTVEVRDGTGGLIANVNIGQGYEAGTPLSIGNGMTLRVSAGMVSDGDQFTSSVVTNPDETGLLAAIGMNTLFVGSSPSDYRIHPDVLADPGLLAHSRSGISGESGLIDRFVALRDEPLFGQGTRTIEEELDEITVRTGIDVDSARLTKEQVESYLSRIQADRDSLSAVDPNEEMIKLLAHQQSFQAAARYLSSVQQTLDELLNII